MIDGTPQFLLEEPRIKVSFLNFGIWGYYFYLPLGYYNKTCSSPRRTFFLQALSFQCTSKLCVNFLNLFLVYIFILIMHNTI